MDASTIARWRMHSLGLHSSSDRAVAEVLTRLGASQGQDFLPGMWSLGQRTRPNLTNTELIDTFDRGEILRTHLLRPTWHLVAPGDLGWLLAATADRVHKLNAYYYRQLGIDDENAGAARSVFETTLAGRHCTRDELLAELSKAGIEASGLRAIYFLMHAELEGAIVSGPLIGKQQSYALVADRIRNFARPDTDHARATLAERYFASRGPATVKDLARWASLTIAQAERARQAADGLVSFDLSGRTYWVHADSHVPDRPGAPAVDLVQAYDECIMSYSESKDVLNAGIPAPGNPPPGFFHALLIDGRVVGHWRYDRDSASRPHDIQVWLYRALTPIEKDAADAAVARFSAFVGGPVTWRVHPS